VFDTLRRGSDRGPRGCPISGYVESRNPRPSLKRGNLLSDRDGYLPGVPCWVATVQPDAEQAAHFYTELFGWEVLTAGG
jgi:hypothetical protein